MTVKVSWGQKLEPHELKERNKKWEDNCQQLKNQLLDCIEGRLKGYDANWEVEDIHPICDNCPEKPGECGLCKVDASMSPHFEKPGIIIKLTTN